MIEIIPSILVDSKDRFEEKLRLVEKDAATVHVDILDNSLFPHATWFDAKEVAAMRSSVDFELHLMVENPIPIVEEWKQYVHGLRRAIVTAEMERPTGTVVGHIRDHLHLEAGVAINPATPLHEIEEVLHTIDALTVMGVHPGSSGQEFEGDYILRKIEQAKKHRPDVPIEIDGGVTQDLLESLVQAGATRICTASLIFNSKDPTAALTKLKNQVSTFGQSM